MAELNLFYRVLLPTCAGILTQRILSPIPEVSTMKAMAAYIAGNLILLLLPKTSILTINVSYLTAFLLSTILHRLYFHPLSRFPGARLAQVSKLYEAYLNLRGANAPTVRDLLRSHGDFVRTGPNELAVSNVEAVSVVWPTTPSPPRRGPFYEFAWPMGGESLITTRNNALHATWRKVWNKGFSSAAMTEYSARVEHHVGRTIALMDVVAGKKGEVDMAPVSVNLSFDIMADLAFSRDPPETIQNGKVDRSYMDCLHGFMRTLGVFASLRNLCDLAPFTPHNSTTKVFAKVGESLLQKRQKLGTTRPDILTHFLAPDAQGNSIFSTQQLLGNVHLVVIGGSDTTSSTLTNLFRLLALHPEKQQKLHAELSRAFPNGETPAYATTTSLPYLNGVINETLRLWPTLPAGAQAITPPEGCVIAGVSVPGNVDIRINHLAIMSDERYFSKASEFIPERWTDELPHMVKDKRAFIPFSHGSHTCVGKPIALAQLRITTSRAVQRFTVRLGPSYDDGVFLRGWKDYITATVGPCPLSFVRREE